MVRNKHIKVENQNGKSALLSAAIIIDYLKDYSDEWENLSTSAKLDDIENEYPKEDDSSINLFNAKIGYVVPKIMLTRLIDEVIISLRDAKPEYLTMFQSFNSLEKVAIYFILLINKDRTVSEVFDMITTNYSGLSKRDVMIKLLSEVDVEETAVDPADPVNGLYRLISSVSTHPTRELSTDAFSFRTGDIEFKEFTFPMHSYNTTKRFGWFDIVPNDTVRNYYDRYMQTWKAADSILGSWHSSSTSVLYKNGNWTDPLINSIMTSIPGPASNKFRNVTNYKDLLNTISHREISFDNSEKLLFKHLGERFFDFNANADTTDDQASKSPLTMTRYSSNDNITKNHFDKSNLKAGWITYDDNFNDLRTVLAYYTSDINFWFTSDRSSNNTAYADYLHTQNADGLLTSNSKSETKGYFSNVMFIQNAIQRVLFPRILKHSQNGYGTNPSDDLIFASDKKIYDTIFDAIVNNSFVYTDKNISTNVIDNNYEIIPNRAILETKLVGATLNTNRDFTNYKATNLYEFIINSLIISKNNVKASGFRKIMTVNDLSLFTRESMLYKGNAINYNIIPSKITNDTSSLTISDFDTNSMVYNFGVNIYDPTGKNWINKIVDAFFKMDANAYSKINYRNMKFFKLPVHSGLESITDELNRNIIRVERELLTDVTDLSNFDIKGLSLADFTYAEKALLREYIDNFKAIKKLSSGIKDYDVIEEMKKDLDYLYAWKVNPSGVAINNKDNTYYKISSMANPKPVGAVNDRARDYQGFLLYTEWLNKLNDLKKNVYFPELLSYADINNIQTFLNRATLKINKNRTASKDPNFVEQAKELLRNSAIKNNYSDYGASSNGSMKLTTVGAYFLTALKLIVSTIKETDEYKTAFEDFNVQFKTGTWTNIGETLNDLRDVLLNNTLIQNAITSNNLYTGYKSGILKDLDVALYRLVISNYFSYLQDTNEAAKTNIADTVFVDNTSAGIIRYYSDLISLLWFAEKYHELVPKYVRYLESNVLNKYYDRIKAVRSLPSWDYESFHRRDREVDLRTSGGINKNDYNIVWDDDYSGLRMIYKGKAGTSSSYRVSGSLYSGGGLSYSGNSNLFRDRWWRKWLTNGSDTFSYDNVGLFKVPNLNITDNNIQFPDVWEYNNPDPTGKATLFNKMRYNNNDLNTGNDEPYQSGKIANISSFRYSDGSSLQYESIGVPLLLMGDDGYEWNKANTIRSASFSFETEFMNLWYTDEKYDNGGTHNKGGGEAYTTSYKLVSTADKYKNFGLGNMDLQKMFRHLWNMESSPMGNPYTVMNYDIFPTWDDDYQYDKGDFPWSTLSEDVFALFKDKWFTETRKKANKYNFKFVLENSYKEGVWSPVRLSGGDRAVGVDSDITNAQICSNFFLISSSAQGLNFTSSDQLATAIFDIYNRNFRNRIYLTYLKWRYYNNLGVW